jgi:DNA-binding GntR family transcriptional regulator
MLDEDEFIEALGRARAGTGAGTGVSELLRGSPRTAHVLLRAAIRRGLVPIASAFEEHSLVLSMRMNRNSIRSALQQLTTEGLVQRKQRVGTSVIRGIAELPLLGFLPVDGWTRDDDARVATRGALEIEYQDAVEVAAEPYVASRLGLETQSVMMREDIVRRDGEPIALLVGYYPIDEDSDGSRPTMDLLRQLPDAHFEVTVEAINCDDRSARLLKVAPGAALLLRETLVRDHDHVPRVLAFGHYRGDRIALWAEDDAVPPMKQQKAS